MYMGEVIIPPVESLPTASSILAALSPPEDAAASLFSEILAQYATGAGTLDGVTGQDVVGATVATNPSPPTNQQPGQTEGDTAASVSAGHAPGAVLVDPESATAAVPEGQAGVAYAEAETVVSSAQPAVNAVVQPDVFEVVDAQTVPSTQVDQSPVASGERPLQPVAARDGAVPSETESAEQPVTMVGETPETTATASFEQAGPERVPVVPPPDPIVVASSAEPSAGVASAPAATAPEVPAGEPSSAAAAPVLMAAPDGKTATVKPDADVLVVAQSTGEMAEPQGDIVAPTREALADAVQQQPPPATGLVPEQTVAITGLEQGTPTVSVVDVMPAVAASTDEAERTPDVETSGASAETVQNVPAPAVVDVDPAVVTGTEEPENAVDVAVPAVSPEIADESAPQNGVEGPEAAPVGANPSPSLTVGRPEPIVVAGLDEPEPADKPVDQPSSAPLIASIDDAERPITAVTPEAAMEPIVLAASGLTTTEEPVAPVVAAVVDDEMPANVSVVDEGTDSPLEESAMPTPPAAPSVEQLFGDNEFEEDVESAGAAEPSPAPIVGSTVPPEVEYVAPETEPDAVGGKLQEPELTAQEAQPPGSVVQPAEQEGPLVGNEQEIPAPETVTATATASSPRVQSATTEPAPVRTFVQAQEVAPAEIGTAEAGAGADPKAEQGGSPPNAVPTGTTNQAPEAVEPYTPDAGANASAFVTNVETKSSGQGESLKEGGPLADVAKAGETASPVAQESVPATDSTAVAKATAAAGVEGRAQAPATSGTDANAEQGTRHETFAETATPVSNHAQQETNVQQAEQEFSLPESYAADRAEKVAGQIVRSARLMTSRDVSEIRLRLEPPTLGEVNLRIVSQDGNAVKLEIVARYAETRSLLESGLPALHEALQNEGVELVHVTVDTSGGEQLDSWLANERNNTMPSDQDTSAQDLRDDALDVATADLRTRIAHDGHLDLVA